MVPAPPAAEGIGTGPMRPGDGKLAEGWLLLTLQETTGSGRTTSYGQNHLVRLELPVKTPLTGCTFPGER
ncbi:hypothetical protein E5288_WYG011420 [Bos mutus]|uniref:Uncharacterized protein n=1 Tax=Bos mutus TaxID=72004 RepID=A0A6B0RD75_9CETA|nr:hypothetical protein [Bos mutus]